MAFNINDLTAYFDNPAVSQFSRSRSWSGSINIGPMIPHNWDILNFGNSAKGQTYHAMRLAPMLAPNFGDLALHEHTAIVPLRVIMKNYEETLNYSENRDGATLPHLTQNQYHDVLLAMSKCGIPIIGSLFDYMRYPVYADLYSLVDTADTDLILTISGDEVGIYDILTRDQFQYCWENDFSVTLSGEFVYRANTYSIFETLSEADAYNIVLFAVLRGGYGLNAMTQHSLYGSSQTITIEKLAEFTGFGTVTNLVNQYKQFLFGKYLHYFLVNSEFTNDKNITTLPLRAYHRFHFDWNVNGNFTNRELELDRVYDFELALNTAARGILTDNAVPESKRILQDLVLPKNRLWDYDFFTSLLPSSAVDNAIEIPANSTVLDLSKLSAFQKLVLKLSYSNRYRDVIWNIFKIRPSDARLQQSSVIARRYHDIGIGETLQTSSTDATSVLGNFSGRGYSAGRGDGFHIFCEEPCVLLNLMSFVPKSVYADSIDPLIHVDDIYDLPIPDMDVLGNQPIFTDLLTGNQADSDIVFGFGRQYQEWLANYSTVHGDFKTSLKYWQLARRFDSVPALNDEFLRINDGNDFDEIFSVPNSSQAFIKMVTNYSVTRHVHRSVRIQI